MFIIILPFVFIGIPLILTYWYNLRKKQVRQEFTILATGAFVYLVHSIYCSGLLATHNINSDPIPIVLFVLPYILLVAQVVLNWYKR